MSNTQQVAVYGSLKKGYGNHTLLESSHYLGITETEKEWTMLSLGGFPGLISGEEAAHIEVYKVTEETFARLDMLEGYPSFYDRKQIETKFGLCWIYYLDKKDDYQFCDIVEGGCW